MQAGFALASIACLCFCVLKRKDAVLTRAGEQNAQDKESGEGKKGRKGQCYRERERLPREEADGTSVRQELPVIVADHTVCSLWMEQDWELDVTVHVKKKKKIVPPRNGEKATADSTVCILMLCR